MHFNLKSHQASKVKESLIKNNIMLLSSGLNHSASKWLVTEQGFYKLNLNYYKICNNAASEIIKNTVFKNAKHLINNTFFFLKFRQKNKNNIKLLLNGLQRINFSLYSIKLNNKLYALPPLRGVEAYPVEYPISIKVLYQFLLVNLKTIYNFKPKNFR